MLQTDYSTRKEFLFSSYTTTRYARGASVHLSLHEGEKAIDFQCKIKTFVIVITSWLDKYHNVSYT